MTTEIVEKIVREYSTLSSQRTSWNSLWQELANFIVPNKNAIQVEKPPGTKRTLELYDSTAIHANNLLAAAMQGNLTSMALRWFSLKMRDEDLNQSQKVAEWLEEVARRIFLALQQSNFGSENQELYIDLGAFGTGAIFVSEKTPQIGRAAGLLFKSFPVGSYVCTENADGVINVIYRIFEFSVTDIMNIWGRKGLNEELGLDLEKDPYKRKKILHAVFPRPGIHEQDVTPSTPARKLPYASFYVELEKKILLAEGGYHEFPYMVPRWSKSSGEVYGRGPGMTALPDIRSLNTVKKLGLSALALAVLPPMTVEDRGMVGRPNLKPLSINVLKREGALKPLDIGANFNAATIKEEELKTSIRQIFFIEQIQFPPKPGTPISATEAQIRFELMQRVLGPTLGRLESEYLSPLLNRVFRIMLRAEELPPVPEEILVAGASDIDVEYQGPLAVAQRAASTETIQRVYGLLFPLSQIVPEVMDTLDHDKVARLVAETNGLPADLFRSEEEIATIRKARLQAQQDKALMADMETGAKAAGKVAPLLKEEPVEAVA